MNVNQIIVPRKLNVDVDERMLKSDESRYKLNLRSGSTEGANQDCSENILGTVEVVNLYHDEGDVEIGSYEDIATNSAFYFFYNPDPTKHKIIRYKPNNYNPEAISPGGDPLPDAVYGSECALVLKHSYLNFQLDHKITDIYVLSGMLGWTDGYFKAYLNNDFNPERKLNIEKAIKFTNRLLTQSFLYTRVESVLAAPYISTECQYVGVGNCPFKVGDKVVAFTNDGPILGRRDPITTGYGIVMEVRRTSGKWYLRTDRVWDSTETSFAYSGQVLLYETGMYFGVDWQTLDLIKYPPAFAPGVSFNDNANFHYNFVRDKNFQFISRFTSDDNEQSVWSPNSKVPHPVTLESYSGSYTHDLTKDNEIVVWVNSGVLEVKTVEIAVRIGNRGNWMIVKRFQKYDEYGNVLEQSDINLRFDFHNNELGEGLVQEDVSRPFDLVPQVAKRMELVEKNRLLLSNYAEGYPNVKIDVGLINDRTDVKTLSDGITKHSGLWGNLGANKKCLPINLIASYDTNGVYCRKFFKAGLLNLYKDSGVRFWEAGYQYSIKITNYPYQYIPFYVYSPYSQTFCDVSPEDYYGCYVEADVSVESPEGDTYKDFLDRVCVALRQGSGNRKKIIAVNNYTYKVFAPYTALIRPQHTWACNNEELGFIIEDTYSTDSVHFANARTTDSVLVEVTKLKDRKIYPTWKSGQFKKLAMGYFDRAKRSGAANKSEQSMIYIPSQIEGGYSHYPYKNTIRWEIKHKPPDWAEYWSWLVAMDRSFWLYAEVCDIHRVTSATASTVSININDNIIQQATNNKSYTGKAYKWEKGDRLRIAWQKNDKEEFLTPAFELDMEIIGTITQEEDITGRYHYVCDRDENFLLDANGNKIPLINYDGFLVPDFNFLEYKIEAENTIVEIYRPLPEGEVQYFEFHERCPIKSPYTDKRVHAINSVFDHNWDRSQNITSNGRLDSARGTFQVGDAFVTARSTIGVFPVERANYSDFFGADDLDIGLVNFVNPNMRRQEYISDIRYGERLIENSQINGMSTFLSTMIDHLAEKFGPVGRMKESGEVIRVLQRGKPTSIYIGKSGLKQANLGGSDLVTSVDSVIGSIMPHPDVFGTIFPESYASNGSYSYFYDIFNHCVCRWANNGVLPIVGKDSNTGWDYGMEKYFRDKSRALLSSGVENINVYSTFEREFGNLIITFIDRRNPLNNETVMFHEPSNCWTTFVSFIPEGYGTCNLIMTSCLKGIIYRHNVSSKRNNFYGVQYPSIVEVVGNMNPAQVKVFEAMEVFSAQLWSAPNTGDVYVKTSGIPMKSRLNASKFRDREGIKVAAFARDMYTHGFESLNDLIVGRPLRGQSIKIRLQNEDTEEVVIMGVNIHAIISE